MFYPHEGHIYYHLVNKMSCFLKVTKYRQSKLHVSYNQSHNYQNAGTDMRQIRDT